jgi:hypothetical protein
VISEVSKVWVDISICKRCILFVLIIRLDIYVIMVFFSMGNLHEIFARITFVRRNFWEEARFLDSRGIEHTS